MSAAAVTRHDSCRLSGLVHDPFPLLDKLLTGHWGRLITVAVSSSIAEVQGPAESSPFGGQAGLPEGIRPGARGSSLPPFGVTRAMEEAIHTDLPARGLPGGDRLRRLDLLLLQHVCH